MHHRLHQHSSHYDIVKKYYGCALYTGMFVRMDTLFCRFLSLACVSMLNQTNTHSTLVPHFIYRCIVDKFYKRLKKPKKKWVSVCKCVLNNKSGYSIRCIHLYITLTVLCTHCNASLKQIKDRYFVMCLNTIYLAIYHNSVARIVCCVRMNRFASHKNKCDMACRVSRARIDTQTHTVSICAVTYFIGK